MNVYGGFPIVREYVEHMVARRLADRTVEQRAMFAQARMIEWGSYVVGSDVIEAWLRRYTGHTLRTYHDHFQALYTWLVAVGQVGENPMAQIPRPPTPRPRPRPLSRQDELRTLLGADGDLRAYLLLGRFAGLRAMEIAKFAGQDIDERSILVEGKGGKIEVLPTHPALWELAQSYPRRGWWFPSDRSTSGHITPHAVTMKVSRYFHRLGIDGSSHRNRHAYGTNLLRGGANIRVVQELMRHSDVSTTIRYLGVDEEEKVAAIKSLTA